MSKIKIGMIGAGFMCKLHSIAFVNYPMYFFPPQKEIELQCISDINKKLADDDMVRYGYKEKEEDWHNLVKRSDIDLVDVVTPNWMHKEMVLETLKNKKHVFCVIYLLTSHRWTVISLKFQFLLIIQYFDHYNY